MLITIIGIPWAIAYFVRWSFVQQEVLFNDSSIRDAFGESARLVKGRWWHTVRVDIFLWLLSIAVGPILGFALIFANLSLLWINLIGSLVYALMIPYVALGQTLLYFDLQAREAKQKASARPSWWRRTRERLSTRRDTPAPTAGSAAG